MKNSELDIVDFAQSGRQPSSCRMRRRRVSERWRKREKERDRRDEGERE